MSFLPVLLSERAEDPCTASVDLANNDFVSLKKGKPTELPDGLAWVCSALSNLSHISFLSIACSLTNKSDVSLRRPSVHSITKKEGNFL